jgi:hypothetical protein
MQQRDGDISRTPTGLPVSCRGLFALTQGYIFASRYEILGIPGQGGMSTI